MAASTLPDSSWELLPAESRARAELSGVLRNGLGSVVLARTHEAVETDVTVAGDIGCWHCRETIPFTGTAFGRVGIGGKLTSVLCPRCRASGEVEFALLPGVAEETLFFVFVPSVVRGKLATEGDSAPCLPLRVVHVTNAPPSSPPSKRHLQGLLTGVEQLLNTQGGIPRAQNLLAELVQSPIKERYRIGLSEAIDSLLERFESPPAVEMLADALLAFRDLRSGKTVNRAVAQSLAAAGGRSAEPLVCENLSLLPLMFGYRSAFQEAQPHFRAAANETLRGRRYRKKLSLEELRSLVDQGVNLTSIESSLGGLRWRELYTMSPTFQDGQSKRQPGTLWGRLRNIMGTPTRTQEKVTEDQDPPPPEREEFFDSLARHYGRSAIDLHWIKMKDAIGAEEDFRKLRRAVARPRGIESELVLFRGKFVEVMETTWILGAICRHSQGEAARQWMEKHLSGLPHRKYDEVDGIRRQPAGSPSWAESLFELAEVHAPVLADQDEE